MIFQNYFGEIAALITAVFWTITAIFFELAGKRIGSLQVNILRLTFAFIILSIFNYFYRGLFFPTDATSFQWFWLFISGLVGFVFGELFLFQAYVIIGARVSMLIMALAPFFSAIAGWLILGEALSLKILLGMFVTFLGIVLVVLGRPVKDGKVNGRFSVGFKHNSLGLLYALGGALGQGLGLVLSKYGMQDYDPFASSQVRIIAGILGFSTIIFFSNRWKILIDSLKETRAITYTTLGAIFGPFLGVSFSLLAVQHTSAGIAATLMSIVPILIIAPAVLIFKEKISVKEILGAVITSVGVAIFFI